MIVITIMTIIMIIIKIIIITKGFKEKRERGGYKNRVIIFCIDNIDKGNTHTRTFSLRCAAQ